MSRPIAEPALQPESFALTPENRGRAEAIVARYPKGRQQSAVMALLDLAQRQHGWLPMAAIEHVAEMLRMPSIRVLEVATFYHMYNLSPVGAHHVRVCTTTPCWLRGSDEVVASCRRVLGISLGETTADGTFTLDEVECLGACVNAPVVQIGDDYYEDVDAAAMERLIEALKRGETPAAGPQVERQTSAPITGPTTLLAKAGEA